MFKTLKSKKIKIIGCSVSVIAALLVGACSNPVSNYTDGDDIITEAGKKLPKDLLDNGYGVNSSWYDLDCAKKTLKNGEQTTCKGTVAKYSTLNAMGDNDKRYEITYKNGSPKVKLVSGLKVSVVSKKLKIGTCEVTVKATADNVKLGPVNSSFGSFKSPVIIETKGKAVDWKYN